MKINKSYFIRSRDFNLQSILGVLSTNGMRIDENGNIVTFICPTEITVNGENVNVEKAMNIVYLLPTCTGKELAYFNAFFNNYIAKILGQSMPEKTVSTESSVLTIDGKIAAFSSIGYRDGCGIGWCTIFMSKPPISGIDFETFVMPEAKDNQTSADIENELHSMIDNAFDLLRRFGTVTAINATL